MKSTDVSHLPEGAKIAGRFLQDLTSVAEKGLPAVVEPESVLRVIPWLAQAFVLYARAYPVRQGPVLGDMAEQVAFRQQTKADEARLLEWGLLTYAKELIPVLERVVRQDTFGHVTVKTSTVELARHILQTLAKPMTAEDIASVAHKLGYATGSAELEVFTRHIRAMEEFKGIL